MNKLSESVIVAVGLTIGTDSSFGSIASCQSVPITSLPDRSTTGGLSTEVTFTRVVIGLDGVFLLSKQIVSITLIPSVGIKLTSLYRIVLNTNSNSSIGAGPDRTRKSLSEEEVTRMLNPSGILTDRFSLVPSNTCSIRMVHWLIISLSISVRETVGKIGTFSSPSWNGTVRMVVGGTSGLLLCSSLWDNTGGSLLGDTLMVIVGVFDGSPSSSTQNTVTYLVDDSSIVSKLLL